MNKNKLTLVQSNFAILQPHIFLSTTACKTIQQVYLFPIEQLYTSEQ